MTAEEAEYELIRLLYEEQQDDQRKHDIIVKIIAAKDTTLDQAIRNVMLSKVGKLCSLLCDVDCIPSYKDRPYGEIVTEWINKEFPEIK